MYDGGPERKMRESDRRWVIGLTLAVVVLGVVGWVVFGGPGR